MRSARGGTIGRLCFGELVTRYEARLFNFLLRRTGGRDDAEELTQEAFARAWARIGTYDRAWRFSTWLFTIGLRLAISKHRRGNRERTGQGPDIASGVAVDSDSRERGARLWAMAEEHLTKDQHTALWLRYAEDMEISEIARVMNKSEVGTRVCLFRARQALAALSGAPNEPTAERRGPAPEAPRRGTAPTSPYSRTPRLIGGAG